MGRRWRAGHRRAGRRRAGHRRPGYGRAGHRGTGHGRSWQRRSWQRGSWQASTWYGRGSWYGWARPGSGGCGGGRSTRVRNGRAWRCRDRPGSRPTRARRAGHRMRRRRGWVAGLRWPGVCLDGLLLGGLLPGWRALPAPVGPGRRERAGRRPRAGARMPRGARVPRTGRRIRPRTGTAGRERTGGVRPGPGRRERAGRRRAGPGRRRPWVRRARSWLAGCGWPRRPRGAGNRAGAARWRGHGGTPGHRAWQRARWSGPGAGRARAGRARQMGRGGRRRWGRSRRRQPARATPPRPRRARGPRHARGVRAGPLGRDRAAGGAGRRGWLVVRGPGWPRPRRWRCPGTGAGMVLVDA